MRVIVITNWVCCFILTVLLQNNHAFNSEKFKITHSNKCSSTETMFRILYEKSLSECVFECDIRPKCAAINYRKRRLQCELLEGSNSTSFVQNSDQTGPCVYIHKRNISLNASEHCGNNCTSGEVCDKNSGQCIILECPPLSLANGDILGNMYNVGARLKTKCTAGFIEVDNNMYTTCNASGRWDPNIRCIAGLIEQWVVSVNSFSSQYSTYSFAAMQVVGQPNMYPQYGDNSRTWAQLIRDAHQYITVTFKEIVLVSGIDIYETYHAGGIRKISAVIPNPETGDSDLIPLYTCPDGGIQNIEHSRIFSPSLQNIGQATNTIRIDVDCSLSGAWVEIDAIQLHGYRVGA